MASRYFIKQGYFENELANTRDENSDGTYWNRRRRRASQYYQWPVYAYASALIRTRHVRRCIDVGCGVGTKLHQLKQSHLRVQFAGIDQASAIEHCRRMFGPDGWYVDDLENPDPALSHLTGDLVICADVIEHVENPDRVLDYLNTRLAPGGVILLSTPERDALRGTNCNTCPNAHHVREWNAAELAAYLSHRGYTIEAQFLQLPVRLGPNLITYNEIVKRFFRRMPLRYNQVCVLSRTY